MLSPTPNRLNAFLECNYFLAAVQKGFDVINIMMN